MRLVPNTDTVPASVNRYLLPHERQVITVHQHPAILIKPIFWVLIGLALAGWLSNVIASKPLEPNRFLISTFRQSSDDAFLDIVRLFANPVKHAEGRYLSDESTMHFGLIPRSNRGIFAINELPDLVGVRAR